jgi:hypothetical protein
MTEPSLRQRKKTTNKHKNSKKESGQSALDTTAFAPPNSHTPQGDNETLAQTFFKHPLIRVVPFILIPYVLYNVIYFLSLSRPDIITQATFGLVKLRPALQPQQEHQVLIVGSEVTENRHVMTGLARSLKLEIFHEAVDAQNYFCRDGSVSWFQIMRFLEPLEESSEFGLDSINELCLTRTESLVGFFHPKHYDYSKCSAREKWSKCWAKECLQIVTSEWGCAWKEDASCTPPFARVLHQVRHPIRTIETLNATFCEKEDLMVPFVRLVSTWFPNLNWDKLSCLEAMSWYVVQFHKTMLKAREAGLVHDMFQVENTSPCEVASQAGFLEGFSAAYEPNPTRLAKLCQDETNTEAQVQNTFSKIKEKNDGKQQEEDKLTFEDFQGGKHGSQRGPADTSLEDEVRKLVKKLGYDQNEHVEFI